MYTVVPHHTWFHIYIYIYAYSFFVSPIQMWHHQNWSVLRIRQCQQKSMRVMLSSLGIFHLFRVCPGHCTVPLPPLLEVVIFQLMVIVHVSMVAPLHAIRNQMAFRQPGGLFYLQLSGWPPLWSLCFLLGSTYLSWQFSCAIKYNCVLSTCSVGVSLFLNILPVVSSHNESWP